MPGVQLVDLCLLKLHLAALASTANDRTVEYRWGGLLRLEPFPRGVAFEFAFRHRVSERPRFAEDAVVWRSTRLEVAFQVGASLLEVRPPQFPHLVAERHQQTL